MLKRRAKKLLALALSIWMLAGTATEWLPTALAAGGQSAVTAPEAATAAQETATAQPRAATEPPARQLDFQKEENGRPNLYVDFLGDNIGNGGTFAPGSLTAPSAYNRDDRTNKNVGNTWSGYTGLAVSNADSAHGKDSIIFWVGVGIDRAQVWELLRKSGNKGLTSLELGFYYNKTYIEPYTGLDSSTATHEDLTAAYENVIRSSNIGGGTYTHNQWSDAYRLLHAETDLKVEEGAILRADPITQDELANPSLDNIRANQYSNEDSETDNDADWRMTYVSLELTDLESLTGRRLAGKYHTYYYYHCDHEECDVDASADWSAFTPVQLDDGTGKMVDGYRVTCAKGHTVELPASELTSGGYELDAQGEPIIPPVASGRDTDPDPNVPEYLMMIPFVVHKHDAHSRLCLRLVRDASHFSIGAGNDGVGDSSEGSYAAWEKVTTRNPGKDLKLQLRFAGDLNIWGTETARVPDEFYSATLLIKNGGGSRNTARLSVQGDPGGTPVFVDRNNQSILHLQGGTGMQLDITIQSGYVATVWVYYEGAKDSSGENVQVGWPFVTVNDEPEAKNCTFVLPHQDTYVLVTFEPGNTRDFTVYLSETPKPYSDADYMLGIETTVSSWLDQTPIEDMGTVPPQLEPVSINSLDPPESHPDDGHGEGPKTMVTKGQTVTVTVSVHPDYEARVYLYSFAAEDNISISTLPPNVERDPTDNDILIMPFGATITFDMPESDVDVVVEYRKVQTRRAKLEVYHTDVDAEYVKTNNIAQLAYLSYDKNTAVTTAYSGQVYEKVDPTDPEDLLKRDHSAVRDPSYKTAQVPYSFATISGSLGGDTGRTGRIWSGSGADGAASLMATLSNATSETNLATRFSALDLFWADLLGDGSYMGLRKNLDGELYGDGDLAEAATLLWELRAKVLADTAIPGGLRETYYKEGTLADGTKFNYFDLTPAQVQAYRVDCLEAEALARENRQAYRVAYRRYQDAKRLYDEARAIEVLASATAPILPQEPLNISYDDATGVRKYQAADYQTVYLASYSTYIEGYITYISDLLKASTPTVAAYAATPGTRPNDVVVPLHSDADAKTAVQNAITTYKWNDRTVENATSEVETTAAVAATRAGRTVWLWLEAESEYEVDRVELLNAAGTAVLTDPVTHADLVASASASFKNLYTFSMPTEDCTVRVYYRRRLQRTLQWQVLHADNEPDNVAHIEAYQVTPEDYLTATLPDPQKESIQPAHSPETPGVTRPTLAKRSNVDHVGDDPYPATLAEPDFPVEGLLAGSTVTIRLTCVEGYKVSVAARNGAGGGAIPVNSNVAAGLYTFIVPNLPPTGDEKVTLTITYSPINDDPLTATIHMVHYDENFSSANTGLWKPDNQSITTRQPGSSLYGEITLEQGYYIYTSYAVGEHGSYPYTLDGNGYNNNLGAGTASADRQRPVVKLNTTMPQEDLDVYIIVRKGVPPVEPGNALTVIVLDEENTDGTPADNWAKAAVYAREDGAKRVELDAAGLGTTGGGRHRVTYDRGDAATGTAILAGDRVELDLSAARDKGFYVAEVSLGPSHLGGDLEWLPVANIATGERKLQFTMPAGSTTVTVRFRKLADGTNLLPSYYIHAMKIETDRNGKVVTDLSSENKITRATSDTIKGFAPLGYPLDNLTNPEQVPRSDKSAGAGVAGETVTMTFQVDKGWYIQSVAVMTDGSARPAEFDVDAPGNDGSGGTFTADLVMPTGDTWFIVKYRQCPEDPEGNIVPRPEIPEYALTLMVIDNDNAIEPKANNTVAASFSGTEGVVHESIAVNMGSEAGTTASAIQYIHAGDRVALEDTLAPGYSIDYIIVNPTELGIVPTYTGTNTSEFTMPARNITVIAKISKKTRQAYTADLILRPPAGVPMRNLGTVGQGTFTNGGGSRDDYYKNAVYSLLLTPGERVDYELFAFDGYYIQRVEVEPTVGTTGSLSGSFGVQTGGFVMPAANVHVNVYFEKLWPDEVKYDLTLKVHDASGMDDNYAAFSSLDAVAIPEANLVKVHGKDTPHTISQAVKDGKEVHVAIHKAEGFYYSPSTISVTDSSGAAISWRMTAQGLAFLMPPRSTTVEITFHKDRRTEEENPARQAILHISGENGNDIIQLYRNDGNVAGDMVVKNNDVIDNLHAGDLLHLNVKIADAEKNTRWVRAAYAVDGATGEQLIVPITQVPGGGLADFPVPLLPKGMTNEPIHVYVSMATKAEDDMDQTMRLMVQGPKDSGSATMESGAQSVTAVAAAVEPQVAMDTLHIPQGNAVTVTMDYDDAQYYISQLVVTDGTGAAVSYDWISMLEDDSTDPSTWSPNPKKQITLAVPATGGTVLVVYAPIPQNPDQPDTPIRYKAQVVVNDSAYTGAKPSPNNAWLSNQVLGQLNKKLVEAKAGQWVDLDITVRAGYRILPVFVSPQSFGIKPQLYLGDLASQTTGFYMPAGDVTVYVTFVDDGLETYNAKLVVNGYPGTDDATGLGSNHADIHSDRTGTKGPIDANELPVSVQAAEREWVTVHYYWTVGDGWVSSVTVKDAAGRNVPFTQEDENTIKVLMVPRDITITVTYERPEVTPPTPIDPPDHPTPELTPVRLHVIDMSADGTINTTALGKARVVHNGTDDPFEGISGDGSTGSVQQTPWLEPWVITPGDTDDKWGHTDVIWVPAGRDITLQAFSDFDQGIFIHSAYVLYRDGGQMIACNLKHNNKDPDLNHDPSDADGFYWDREATFQAHPDYNDVYVYFTKEAPKVNEYAATLMLKSDEEDTSSAAAIWTQGREVEKATVIANGDHGRVVAERKDTVNVTVTPAEGYAIDYILVTPLGIPLSPVKVGNGYTFTMPGYNVSICVYLKRSNEREFHATVHYISVKPDANGLGTHNKATITWSPDGTNKLSEFATPSQLDSPRMVVNENATVTLDVTLDDPYYVQAAYVLRGGTLVPLSPALEGTKEVNSTEDKDQEAPDGTATFTMPSGDVDVFVAFTDEFVDPTWHTVVLVASDTSPAGNNLGANRGFLNVAGAPEEERQTAFSFDAYKRMDVNPTPADPNTPPTPPTWNPPSYFAHTFMTLPEFKEDGSINEYTVVAQPADGYTFNSYKSGLTKNDPVYAQALTPVTVNPLYTYREPVGSSNRAVHLVFESNDDLKLTVVLDDHDNPGDGTVTNGADVTADGVDKLELRSESALGSYQIMSGLAAAATVDFVVKPEEGFSAMAKLEAGGETTYLPLTPGVENGENVLNGSFPMPANDATLTITFFIPYEAELVLEDRTTAHNHGAKMTEDTGTAPDTVSVNAATVSSRTLEDLPNRTGLTAQMTDDIKATEKVTALVTEKVSGSTRLLSAETGDGGAEVYRHTIDRSDATITLVVTDHDPANPESDPYIAAVRTVNKPAGTNAPTIAATPLGVATGAVWTTAYKDNTVTVTFDVPDGYEAELSTDNGLTLTPAGPVNGPVTGQTTAFTMPAANVQVTITYRKVNFDLTLRIVDATGKVNTTSVAPAAVISGTDPLTQNNDAAVVQYGTNVAVSATPGSGASIRSITVSPAVGANTYLVSAPKAVGEAYTDSFAMPQADTVVTVVYGGDPNDPNDKPYYLAYSAVDDPANAPGNRVVSIRNITRSDLPTSSPTWAAGYGKDSVTVSYETAPDYFVTASAKRNRDDKDIPVVLLDHGTGGTATAAFPDGTEAGDITITIHYTTEEPPKLTKKVALQLIGHKEDPANAAHTTAVSGTLTDLALDGTYGTYAPGYGSAGDPVEKIAPQAITGEDLRTLATWATNGHVVRVTVAVRQYDTDDTTMLGETGEVDLQLSEYAGSVTSRVTMPTVGEHEIAVIRVYYGNIFWARLNLHPHGGNGQDVPPNHTSAVTTGHAPINTHLDRLEDLMGDEAITVTAAPGAGWRLVGGPASGTPTGTVVWECDSLGAQSATRSGTGDNFTFDMPGENVDFYVTYEPEDQRSYIAKVQFNGTGHLGDSQNAVSIVNESDSAAVAGRYWTAAKAGETVAVNVKVAPGYRAEITMTRKDHAATHASDNFDFYISRTLFFPNQPLGKDGVFTMPADTDATVLIRFVKGYDLSLEVADASGVASAAAKNAAEVAGAAETLRGESNGTDITYTPADKVVTDAADKALRVTTRDVAHGTNLQTDVSPAQDTVRYKLYRASPFSGTALVGDHADGKSAYPFPMPQQDVTESVVFYDEDHPLMAKVELRGESDINGNTATPIVDATDPAGTATGTVWTTTTHATSKTDAHTIDLQITVAKGYVAKIKVRRDNQAYTDNPNDETKWEWLDGADYDFTHVYDDGSGTDKSVTMASSHGSIEVPIGYQEGLLPPGAFPDSVSGPQHFRFTMAYDENIPDADGKTWTASDVTVIVRFEFAGDIPQPFDPDNMEMEKMDLPRGFVYGENLGDHALIDIPTLYQAEQNKLYDTDNYTEYTNRGTTLRPALEAEKEVRFHFFLYDAAADAYTPLVLGTDVLLEPEDEETLATAGDPYNYYDYETKRADASNVLNDREDDDPEQTYVGSRFKLIPTEPDEFGVRTTGAQAVYDMLENDGSLARQGDKTLATNASGKYYTTLYVIAEDAVGQKSAYTPVWIRPHFTVAVQVISYAPNHVTTANLYAHAGDNEPDTTAQPVTTAQMGYTGAVLGGNKYYQKLKLKSSELLGGYTTAYDPSGDLLNNVDATAAATGEYTYAMTLEKVSSLTYTRVKLDLWTGVDLTAGTRPSWYDTDTLTYTISDLVYFITGDVDGDGRTKWQDYNFLYSYVWRGLPWTDVKEAPDPADPNYSTLLADWAISTYNPDSMAYRCDLNGDGRITTQDLNLVQTVFDYNRTVEDYKWTYPTTKAKVLPFGFGADKSGYAALFDLGWGDDEPVPVDPDPYWDSLVDPETTDAPPLDELWAYEDGTLWDGLVEEEAVEEKRRPAASREEEKGAVSELPGGEETGEWSELPVFDPDWRAELPSLPPDGEEDLP